MPRPDYLSASLRDVLIDEEHWVRSYGKGRICTEDGCTTILSMYNPESRCELHKLVDTSRVAPTGFRRCVDCGEVLPADEENFATTNTTRGEKHWRNIRHVCRLCWAARRTDPTHMRSRYATGVEQATVRVCTRCGIEKPLSREHFGYDGKGRTGFRYRCLLCERKVRKEMRAAKRAEELGEVTP